MTEREKYAPGPAAGASVDKAVHEDGEKWALVVVRELRHPPEMVWQALTDPAQLSEWAPFDADRNLAAVGPVKLSTVGTPTPQVSESTVTRAEAPRRLEHSWAGNELRWELEALNSHRRELADARRWAGSVGRSRRVATRTSTSESMLAATGRSSAARSAILREAAGAGQAGSVATEASPQTTTGAAPTGSSAPGATPAAAQPATPAAPRAPAAQVPTASAPGPARPLAAAPSPPPAAPAPPAGAPAAEPADTLARLREAKRRTRS